MVTRSSTEPELCRRHSAARSPSNHLKTCRRRHSPSRYPRKRRAAAAEGPLQLLQPCIALSPLPPLSSITCARATTASDVPPLMSFTPLRALTARGVSSPHPARTSWPRSCQDDVSGKALQFRLQRLAVHDAAFGIGRKVLKRAVHARVIAGEFLEQDQVIRVRTVIADIAPELVKHLAQHGLASTSSFLTEPNMLSSVLSLLRACPTTRSTSAGLWTSGLDSICRSLSMDCDTAASPPSCWRIEPILASTCEKLPELGFSTRSAAEEAT